MTHKVGPKGQVVIPKDMRDRLGILPGDEVAFRIDDGGVLVEPVRADRGIRKGMFARSGMLADLEAEHRQEIERDERRS